MRGEQKYLRGAGELRVAFRQMQWLFPMAVALHNGEEAWGMPHWVQAHGSQLPFQPGAVEIRGGLLLLTALVLP